MIGVGKPLDQPAPLKAVDLLGDRAGSHQQSLEQVGWAQGVGWSATPQCQQHPHVPGAHAKTRLAHAVVLVFDELAEPAQIDGEQEIAEIEVGPLLPPLPRDVLDNAFAVRRLHSPTPCRGVIAPLGVVVSLPSMEDEWSYGHMAWQLRYASHLGYRSSEEPLFKGSVGSLDPLAHVEYAASIGFSGVQYALARGRPRAEQEAVGAALARRELEAGCVIYTTFNKIRQPLWSDTGHEARATLAEELALSFDTARRVGSRYLAVLSGLDPSREEKPQRAAFVENLRWAAERAEQAGMVLLLESVDRSRLPGMLLHHIADAHEMIAAVDSPSVRLIFDTAHIQAMDGDLIAHLEATWDAIAVVQLADTPGRLEPGTGDVDFAGVLGVLKRRGFRGLVELEFGWSVPGRDAEQAGLERLRQLDAA